MEPGYDLAGIGNALVDVVRHVDDGFLHEHGLTKGAMTLVDEARSEELYGLMSECVECSGGSAANTIVGAAALGAQTIYIGKVRDDGLGRTFQRDIRVSGVHFDVPLAADGPATGRCLVFVTPDAQRTMQTFLGASATLGPDDVDPEAVGAARIVYLEGYMYDPPPAKAAFLLAAEIAHRAGRKVALSLSDAFCVDRHRADFLALVRGHVDVVFANEEEVVSLYQATGLEPALARLRTDCETAVVTLGERGSMVAGRGEVIEIAPHLEGPVVDTTGAGDLFAAGFLWGLSQGRGIRDCGRLGSIAAGEIISHFGARPACSLRDLAKRCGAC